MGDFGLKRYEFAFGSKARTESHTYVSGVVGAPGASASQNHGATRASYTFTSSFTSHHTNSHHHHHHHNHSNSLGNPGGGCQLNSCPFFITSPYLPPEYPLHPKVRTSIYIHLPSMPLSYPYFAMYTFTLTSYIVIKPQQFLNLSNTMSNAAKDTPTK